MVLLAVIEIEGVRLGGEGRRVGVRRTRQGGLVWETVKRGGRSWSCGRFISRGTRTYASARVPACSWRRVRGVLDACSGGRPC